MNEQNKSIEKIRKSGSGRTIGALNNKFKYLLKYNNTIYVLKTIQEIADITKKNRLCISRLLNKKTFINRKMTQEMKQIKIYRLKELLNDDINNMFNNNI